MAVEVKLPQWGMGMTEGTITEWLVAVGDSVAEGDELVNIETAKAEDVVVAPVSGVIASLHGDVDDDIPVGDVLVVIDES
ncbi:MAG: biotin/lipoyl-containing protein [Mycetocola sp.]